MYLTPSNLTNIRFSARATTTASILDHWKAYLSPTHFPRSLSSYIPPATRTTVISRTTLSIHTLYRHTSFQKRGIELKGTLNPSISLSTTASSSSSFPRVVSWGSSAPRPHSGFTCAPNGVIRGREDDRCCRSPSGCEGGAFLAI